MIEQIGKELKAIRVRSGYTLEEASKITGITRNVLWAYEKYPKRLSAYKLLEILDSYNVDVLIFFKNCREYIYNK